MKVCIEILTFFSYIMLPFKYSRTYCILQRQSACKKRVAKWRKRNLPYFDSTWLYYDQPDEYLVEIDLSHNSLFNIDGDIIWNLPNLEVLNLSWCALRQIPEIKKDNHFAELR